MVVDAAIGLLKARRVSAALVSAGGDLELPGCTGRATSVHIAPWLCGDCASAPKEPATLRPLGRKIDFVPGQFAMVYVEAKDGWHRHPFTIASAPHEDLLRVTVKALCDYTSPLPDLVEAGMPAVVGGPHGRFSYSKGTERQIWIAGGVGVAPFLSWLRALDGALPYRVEFFYSAEGDPPFANEIRAIADRHESLRVHLFDTSRHGRLTPGRVLEETGSNPRDLSVFMCGPQPMLRSFQTQLVLAGVSARKIHREYFDWR